MLIAERKLEGNRASHELVEKMRSSLYRVSCSLSPVHVYRQLFKYMSFSSKEFKNHRK